MKVGNNTVLPDVEIETKYHSWDFSPILNVIVTQLRGDLGGTIRKVSQLLPVTGIYWVSTG